MRRAVVLCLGMLLAGCGSSDGPEIGDAWIRLPALPGRPGAAYFTLDAGGKAAALTAVETPLAARAELHESMAAAGGAMTMAPLRSVSVAAGGKIVFAPGGKHVMLFDLDRSAAPGITTTLTLRFADGEAMTMDAQVVGAGDPAPAS